jgi:hypothetical protein
MVSFRSGIYLILLSILASFILVVSTNLNKYELGALIILVLPFIIGLVSIAIYAIITFVFKNSRIRLITVALCLLYNLYVGIAFHFDMANLPLLR